MAREYLSTLCQPVSSVRPRRHLRSASRGELDIPRVNLATYSGGKSGLTDMVCYKRLLYMVGL